MRLLNTRTLQFQEFFDSQIPKYAILSHRWGNEEVTFQEFRKGKKQHHEGYVKIEQCSVLAGSRGFQWVWIDTCCIDKKSSAELSEAINSMYRWYQGAGECYAYLSDVTWDSRDIEGSKKVFGQSLWFTRGWTLQELLAPDQVIFFDNKWNSFGTKQDLRTKISAVTGIEANYVISIPPKYFSNAPCVAKKMSWLSRRVTSRAEDMAYCMLGLFDVNMPLLYGEGGKKAFLRLQLEIIRKSDDESIFAWTSNRNSSGMLAFHPSDFANSGDITICGSSGKKRFPYFMTNQGLEFQVPVRKYTKRKASDNHSLLPERVSLALNCWRDGGKGDCAITIAFKWYGKSWHRIKCDSLPSIESVKDSMSEDGRFKYTAALHIHQPGL
ncbi:MAG: hypothetical protein ALECFALPRED_007343 [Alectoria fallacina]|uniref:Heterokaryon incompatibility domain-containing protein n=1 Tax=Alectoria fallacina TaxID=1903189 RepID=A0A8H3ETQ9_9LECA|nr:MAG: hypothetical protein ALECFALPRED_007343 [Alectoria fallacina]